jgi:hypothetical protein
VTLDEKMIGFNYFIDTLKDVQQKQASLHEDKSDEKLCAQVG